MAAIFLPLQLDSNITNGVVHMVAAMAMVVATVPQVNGFQPYFVQLQ